MSKNIFIRQFLSVVVITITVISLWILAVIPEYEKLPSNFTLDMEYEGEDQITDNVNTELSPVYRLKDTLSQRAIDNNNNILTIASTVTGMKADTGEIIFEDKRTYHVNQYTLMHSDMENKKFGFLPGVEKRDYDFLHPLIFDNTTLIFQGTDEVNGLEAYIFETKSLRLDVSSAFHQFYPNTILADTDAKLWIEPITGNIIRFEKRWDNYLIEDGQRKNTVEKGWKHTTAFTESILAQYTKTKIDNLRFAKILMPVLLASIILGSGTILILLYKLKTAREEMERKEKLTILGNLTARIAHDFRNPLSIITNGIQILAIQEKQNPEISRKIQILQRAADRMTHQINNVMDFVRTKPLSIERVSLKTAIMSAIENSKIPNEIRVTPPESDITITGDFHQLETMLSNVLTNSAQALNGVGEITITIAEKPNTVEIQITDSGPGIPDEHLNKIWEPLFTTKQTGTGLGLVSVKTIVDAHGGSITAKNNPTTFTIELPKSQPVKTV